MNYELIFGLVGTSLTYRIHFITCHWLITFCHLFVGVHQEVIKQILNYILHYITYHSICSYLYRELLTEFLFYISFLSFYCLIFMKITFNGLRIHFLDGFPIVKSLLGRHLFLPCLLLLPWIFIINIHSDFFGELYKCWKSTFLFNNILFLL